MVKGGKKNSDLNTDLSTGFDDIESATTLSSLISRSSSHAFERQNYFKNRKLSDPTEYLDDNIIESNHLNNSNNNITNNNNNIITHTDHQNILNTSTSSTSSSSLLSTNNSISSSQNSSSSINNSNSNIQLNHSSSGSSNQIQLPKIDIIGAPNIDGHHHHHHRSDDNGSSSSPPSPTSSSHQLSKSSEMKKKSNKSRVRAMSLVSTVLIISQLLGIFMFARGFFPRKSLIQGYNSFDQYPSSCVDNNIKVEPQFDKVVFMVVDAFRSSFIFGEDQLAMNYTKSLIDAGKTHSFIARANAPTVTLPRIKALLSGGIPSFVDFIYNFNSNDLREDNILHQMKQANKSMIFFGDDTWLKLFPNHFKRSDGTTSFYVADTVEVDNNVTRHLDEEFENDDWDAMFLHYLGLDHIGHLEGPYSPLMGPKQEEIDGIVQRIHQNIVRRDQLKMEQYHNASKYDDSIVKPLPTLFILCSDHGMNEIGNHGGSTDSETSAVLIMISSFSWSLSPTHSHFHENAAGLYIRFLDGLQSEFSALLTSFDDDLLLIGILLIGSSALVTLLVTIATIAMNDHQVNLEIKGVAFAIVFILFLIVLLGIHFTITCMSGETDYNYFCEDEFKFGVLSFVFTALSLLIGFNVFFSKNNLKLLTYPSLSPLQLRKEKYIIIIGTIIHLISLFGSSLVEEEHQTWYFLTVSVILLQLAPHSVAILYKITNHSPKVYKDSLRQMFILLGILVGLRVVRIWNQTGIKWLDDQELLHEYTYIDMAKFLTSNNSISHATLWLLSLVSVSAPCIYVFRILDKLKYRRGGIISQVILCAVSIFCYKWEYIPARLVESVFIARFVYICVSFLMLITITFPFFSKNFSSNTIVVYCNFEICTDFDCGESDDVVFTVAQDTQYDTGRRARSGMTGVIVGLICINWLGQFGYFALGNSNSLSSIDISGSYTGLIDYNQYLVGLLTFVIGYSSPIFFFFVSISYYSGLAIKNTNDSINQSEPTLNTPRSINDILDELQWYSLVGSLLDCGIKWTNVTTITMKYYYTYILSLYFILNIAVALSIESNNRFKKAEDYEVRGKPLNHIDWEQQLVLTEWDIIGPFPSAPREDGNDVLDAFGGITGIPRGDKSTYPTDITDNGRAGWTHINVPDGNVNINYNETQGVNWPLIEAWAGSSGSYFAGWALSDFYLYTEQVVVVQCQGVSRYYIDDVPQMGDSYGSGIAFGGLTLQAGNHTVRVRLIGSEGVGFFCSVQTIAKTSPPFFFYINDILVPDVVGGSFSSPYVSVTVLNLIDMPLQVTEATAPFPFELELIERLEPVAVGQMTPINFKISAVNNQFSCVNNQLSIPVALTTDAGIDDISIQVNFSCKAFGEPYLFTFLDCDNSVQYAAATPPLYECATGKCPVLLTLHGAGVEAASTAWTGAYQRQNYSWTLFPTNRRNYGFDWQNMGLVNAFEALNALATNLPGVPSSLQSKFGADPYRILYAGHSMGGHGCWTISTHYPDRALSVSPAAGWIDMSVYSPFFLKLGNSWTDPFVRFILDASIGDYNNDMYIGNLANIPLLARFGSIDDNVPPYHLRRMVRLYDEINHNSSAGIISEVPGEGHWFNGVVDDAFMQAFFNAHVNTNIPSLATTFTVTTLNPATSGPKGGISIVQFLQPYRVAKIKVTQQTSSNWVLITQNVRRFGFDSHFGQKPTTVVIDGQQFSYAALPNSHYCQLNPGKWQVCTDQSWLFSERNPSNYGPVIQILQSPILFVYGTTGDNNQTAQYLQMATYLTNLFYYQERYAIEIMPDTGFTVDLLNTYNVVLFGGPRTNKVSSNFQSVFPVKFSSGATQSWTIGTNTFSSPQSALLFLSPCTQKNNQYRQGCMMAVLDGTDSVGLNKALTLFPTKSSFAMPDFAVAGPTYGYSGSAGLQALGFWNNFWQYDITNSYVSYIQH
ncbi:transmembrane protein [Heterostelium album PN500]|uniref:Transmembrane protein n=1 Tax=Heterostelium pallidum (strain ATCC 26659 / Pp 5 / PN500) TaxID=670386 RepID=D3BKR4_HETP5|nr:transmembrane protein [Heterostelium album PN500]EFA78494.1 transmembrane protein [Heterostelium album PN500]|eukprot:XP_020430618.1 transmembrane protein [Heterostelium album PN500]